MLTDASRTRDFPGLKGLTYLNTAAESIPPLQVGEAVAQYVADKQLGMRGRDRHFAAVESCREIAAEFMALKPSEVSFCSCSSEAYNLLDSALGLQAGEEVVVTDLDFPAGVTPWLRPGSAAVVKLWRAREGELWVADLLPLLNERTRLVQVSLVSFYNGHRIDWEALVEAVRAVAPAVIISVDVTQAMGRVELPQSGADILISSTHKWTLGIHGGCVIGVPEAGAERLTTRAGGWYHLENAFEADRFERVVSKRGAASFSVGMPNFVSLYALDAALRYVKGVGLRAIGQQADPLVRAAYEGLKQLGLEPLCPLREGRQTGIVSFKHERSAAMHEVLEAESIHVMHQAGRVRLAFHGYNTAADVEQVLRVLGGVL
jgi:cysteine desulfurase / selenocysteine lyase